MIAITLGYTANGRTAVPSVLYCGTDASAADAVSLAPPPDIIRTELIKHPLVSRRRYFTPPPPAVPVMEPMNMELADPVKPPRGKPAAPA